MNLTLSWADRIKIAKKGGHFTIEDASLVQDWTGCAVGEKCDIKEALSMSQIEELLGTHLLNLGMDFARAIQYDDIKEAERIYKEIRKDD